MKSRSLQQVTRLEDLGTRVIRFVDCYVSTDANEVADVLETIGYSSSCVDQREGKTLLDRYEEIYRVIGTTDYSYCYLRHERTDLEIDCVDIPLEEALSQRKQLGFMSMSKFRIYTTGGQVLLIEFYFQ